MKTNRPLYRLRPLLEAEIPRLAEINPTFTAETVLNVEREGQPPFLNWILHETPLPKPFDKGTAYDFDSTEQAYIRDRLREGNCLLEVIEDTRSKKLVGVLDVTEENWRKTAWIWNLMLDVEARGQGLGRKLFERTIVWAHKRKLRAILLETQSNNTPACHFYAHLGFKLVGVHDVYYGNDDMALKEVALFWSYPLD